MTNSKYSINDRRWLKIPSPELKDSLPSNEYSQSFQKIIQRKLLKNQAVSEFLNPKLEDLFNPLLLKDMQKSVERIQLAMAKNEAIWIYGDYDVDGITSVALLLKCFKQLDYPVNYYIPDRHEEGYGLNMNAVNSIKEQGGRVLITVDCGISAVKEAILCKSIGLDMIITDHHECQAEIPDAFAIINPKQPSCTYPYEMLAGVGIAYKLSTVLLGELLPTIHDELCELAAFGTIADIAPLTIENRILAKFGLAALSQTKNLGFQALISCSDLNNKKITAGHVGFMLAPKINAAGRIDDPKLGVILLTTEDPVEAEEIAILLKETNDRRQQIEKTILEEALYQLDHQIDFNKNRISIAYGEGWNSGVIGIVASRLVEKYHRPAIVFSINDGKAKGSARSVEGFDVFKALSQFTELYEKFGGHEQAAGLTIPIENFELFQTSLKTYCLENLEEHLLTPSVKIDEVVEVSDVSYEFLEELSQLEPYGMGNAKPIFKLEGVVIKKKVLLGKNKEFTKFEIADGVRTFEAISFDKSGYYDLYKPGDMIDLVCHIDINEFRGTQTIQFLIKDIRGYREALCKLPKSIYLFKRAQAQRITQMAFDLMNHKTELVGDSSIWGHEALLISESLSSAETNWSVDSIEGLIYFYNRLSDNESRPSILKPYKVTSTDVQVQSVETYFNLTQDAISARQVSGWIPERIDLIEFYKSLKSGTYNERLPETIEHWLCTLILGEAKLLEVHEEGIELLTTPKEKVDMMELPIYKALQNYKTTLKNH